jgi:hypothetical protein
MPESRQRGAWPIVLRNISDETKDHLSVVRGYLGLLRAGRAGAVSEQQAQFTDAALRAVENLASLATQVRDLAKLESGESGLRCTDVVDLERLLGEIARDRSEAGEQAVVDLSFSGSTRIEGVDAAALGTAFRLLLARFRFEAADEAGRLTVRMQSRLIGGEAVVWITFGEPSLLDRLDHATPEELLPFAAWRHTVASFTGQRILEMHGGVLYQLKDGYRSPSAVLLPQRRQAGGQTQVS